MYRKRRCYRRTSEHCLKDGPPVQSSAAAAAQLEAYFYSADGDDLLDVVGQWIIDSDVHSDDNDDVDQRFR